MTTAVATKEQLDTVDIALGELPVNELDWLIHAVMQAGLPDRRLAMCWRPVYGVYGYPNRNWEEIEPVEEAERIPRQRWIELTARLEVLWAAQEQIAETGCTDLTISASLVPDMVLADMAIRWAMRRAEALFVEPQVPSFSQFARTDVGFEAYLLAEDAYHAACKHNHETALRQAKQEALEHPAAKVLAQRKHSELDFKQFFQQ